MTSGKLCIYFIYVLVLSYLVYNIIHLSDIGKIVKEIGVNNLYCHKVNYRNPIEDFVKINESLIIGS